MQPTFLFAAQPVTFHVGALALVPQHNRVFFCGRDRKAFGYLNPVSGDVWPLSSLRPPPSFFEFQGLSLGRGETKSLEKRRATKSPNIHTHLWGLRRMPISLGCSLTI